MSGKACNIILFEGFETLDAMGPAEVLGRMPEHYRIDCYSPDGADVVSGQNVRFRTQPFSAMDRGGILVIPGGMATRSLVLDAAYLDQLRELSEASEFVLTVCTGSALLAATGLLDGLEATTNKIAFQWVVSVRPEVNWRRSARWTLAGKYYTSSGVSAGIDMALGFLADRHGSPQAVEAARQIEYRWDGDRENDPFAAAGH